VNYDVKSTLTPECLINRCYDPETGQFLSIDPDLATTLEAYLYAGDDPVNATDPDGLCLLDLCHLLHGIDVVWHDAAHGFYVTIRAIGHVAACAAEWVKTHPQDVALVLGVAASFATGDLAVGLAAAAAPANAGAGVNDGTHGRWGDMAMDIIGSLSEGGEAALEKLADAEDARAVDHFLENPARAGARSVLEQDAGYSRANAQKLDKLSSVIGLIGVVSSAGSGVDRVWR
jgi:RHS repeat-associated protein